MSTIKTIPNIGSTGHYKLVAPFNTLLGTNERVTLKSIRKISEYIAYNQDIYSKIYVKNNIADKYPQDLKDDIEILGLHTENGSWIYVPSTFVSCYPDVNGVPYRTVSLVIPLQPIPANKDLSYLLSEINILISTHLGFSIDTKIVETSKVMMISTSTHNQIEAARELLKSNNSFYAQMLSLNRQLLLANEKVYALEDYVKNHPK